LKRLKEWLNCFFLERFLGGFGFTNLGLRVKRGTYTLQSEVSF